MNFEKWHALGNDYLIVEQSVLPFELTPARVRALCAAHTGVSADGVLLLSEPEPASAERGVVAHLRIFNPDGSEAELSGNGAREAVLYLHRHGRVSTGELTLSTAAGEIRACVTSPQTCTMELGTARLRSDDFPSGPPDGRGELVAGGRAWRFQHVQVGNPQCAIEVSDLEELTELDLNEVGPEIECHALFPRRTNVSWFTATGPDEIRARIFERGVGETSASGTGATGAAVAHVLARGESPVRVQLDGGELTVAVDAELQLNLTGWAMPLFSGALANDFLEELNATE